MHELQPEIERLYGTGRARRRKEPNASDVFIRFRDALDRGPDPRRREDRRPLADEYLGERRNSAGLSHRQAGGERRPARALVRRQGYVSHAALRRQRAGARDSRRLVGAQRRLRRIVGGLHAADVHQCRRLRGRGHNGRFARAGGLVCAGGQARAYQRRCADRWSAGADQCFARDHRGRCAGGRQLRHLRRNAGGNARRAWRRHNPDTVDSAVRHREGRDLSRYRGRAAARSRRRGGGAGLACDNQGQSRRVGPVACTRRSS